MRPALGKRRCQTGRVQRPRARGRKRHEKVFCSRQPGILQRSFNGLSGGAASGGGETRSRVQGLADKIRLNISDCREPFRPGKRRATSADEGTIIRGHVFFSTESRLPAGRDLKKSRQRRKGGVGKCRYGIFHADQRGELWVGKWKAGRRGEEEPRLKSVRARD